jgi:hypothetical protein
MMEDLSLHILDIAENAIAAGATRIAVTINENDGRDLLTIRVADNGRGMSKKTLRLALDPFFSTKGKATGLGLALLAQAAEHCGGGLAITTAPYQGTRVMARFRLGHIDRPPLTNMTSTLTTLVLGHPEIAFRFCQRRNGRVFRFDGRRFIRDFQAAGSLTAAMIGAVKKELRTGLKSLGRT